MTSWLCLFLMVAVVHSCVSIPEKNWIIRHRNSHFTKLQATDCSVAASKLLSMAGPGHFQETSAPMPFIYGLNANGFGFTTWNIKKGGTEGWDEDFKKLCRNTDIFILQEAYLTDSFIKALQRQKYQWDLSIAYAYRKIEAGVLTASKITPNLTCTLKVKEPITRVPKSILITRYPIAGLHWELMVANIHSINFTIGYTAFQKQCDHLESVLANHRGPMIVSGDFNTWNSGRMARVDAMAQRMNLIAVRFKENVKSTFLGYHVDHIYYRGLETIHKIVYKVTTSDHNPLAVVFKVNEQSKGQGS